MPKYVIVDEKPEINPINDKLQKDYLAYLGAKGRSWRTLRDYRNCLRRFFLWNLTYNEDKDFIDITGEDFVRFRDYEVKLENWTNAMVWLHEAAISALTTYITKELADDKYYGGYRNVIGGVRIRAKDVKLKNGDISHDQLHEMLDVFIDSERYESACLLALAMYSGKPKNDLVKLKADDFRKGNIYKDILYKIPVGKQYFYVLKDKFDPYLEIWLEQREMLGFGDSPWLFPEPNHPERPWYLENKREAFAIAAFDEKHAFRWSYVLKYSTREFIEADLPYDILHEMACIDKKEMIAMYVGNRKET